MYSQATFLVVTLVVAVVVSLLGGAAATVIARMASMPPRVIWSAFGYTAGTLVTAVLLYASIVAQTFGSG